MKARLSAPMLLVAALLLVLNDHVLKGVAPGAITGKLSDVCGVFVLPIVIVRLGRMESRRAHALVCFVSAALFALVKTTPWANAIYGAILGRTLIDPTDLVALPAALLAFLALGLPRAPLSSKTWRDRLTLVFAGLGCMATSSPKQPYDPSQMHAAPAMTVAQGEACAVITTAGIEPLGQSANVHFTAKNTVDTDCEVELTTDVTAKSDVGMAEVTVRGQTTVTVPPGTTMDVVIPVRGAYPIACTGDPLVNWNVVQTKAPAGGPYRSPGGGRSGCWQSMAIAPVP